MRFRDGRGFELLALPAEVREMDRLTIEEMGLPGRVLMELAGAGTARLIEERTGGRTGRATVLCGGGNNGGDGYVIARHLQDAGWAVRCVATVAAPGLSGDAASNHALWQALGGETRVLGTKVTAAVVNWIGHADVVVDALFGTGLSRPLGGVAAGLIEACNERGHGLRVAVDVPSGLRADGTSAEGVVFRADLTATYGIAKPGLYEQPGASSAGEVAVVPIALPRALVDRVGASGRLVSDAAVAALLPRRGAASHKGTFGHVGILGGEADKEGAAVLAALGALRAGAGLVTWSRRGHTHAVERPPEIMSHDLAQGLDSRSDVLVVGPGLGTDAQAQATLDAALASGRPLVLDADALNLLASAPQPLPPGTVVTPHPAEAARLLGSTTQAVQADRRSAAIALAQRLGAVCVLKGAASLICAPDGPVYVAPVSEPTLSVGGSGDVLAGALGAMRAAGLEALDAAIVAVWLHGLAGRRAGLGRPEGGVLPSEFAALLADVRGELAAGFSA